MIDVIFEEGLVHEMVGGELARMDGDTRVAGICYRTSSSSSSTPLLIYLEDFGRVGQAELDNLR